ncbi:14778_t:CDS:2, partial [Dentiscutata erythropus]
ANIRWCVLQTPPETSPNSKVLLSTSRTNIISSEASPIQRIPLEALTNSRVLRSASWIKMTHTDVN